MSVNVLIVLLSVCCGMAGPAVIAHPHILEKEACECHVQRCPVLSVCPSVGGGREMTAILLPRGQGGCTELAFFLSERVFVFFSPPFVLLMCTLQPDKVLLFYISSLTSGKLLI